jgi:hypothetical protein
MAILRRMLSALCALLIASGCATRMPMGVTKDTAKIDVSSQSTVLMTSSLANAFKESFHPETHFLNVEKPNAQSASDRPNFVADSEGALISDSGNQYLYRMQIAPGQYSLIAVTGFARRFPIMGTFQVPMLLEFDVPPNSVIYLGRLMAKTRERAETEFRAGPLIPLVDQAVSGFSRTTWDVEIRDDEADDLQNFRRGFPALRDVTVIKRLLHRWDRARAQEWWDKK